MGGDACITDEALAAWASGAASETDVAAMTAHVAACDSCRVVLAEVTRTTGERPAPRVAGRYLLQEKLGEGGMGTVWAAWDPTVSRRVAVKVLHESPGDAGHRARRFAHERQVLGGLQHPHIARLLDAGETDDGRPWFAMDFVDGLPLDAYCDDRRLAPRQRLELMLPVFEAVAFAHRHLVVHRDLKPGNILVGADGAPRLVDFGIARLLEGDDGGGLTQTGMTPMTPAYASPEQVRREPLTTATDVYSLGVVLYELLAGVAPYEAAPGQLDALLSAIRDVEPPPPSHAVARAGDAAVACRAPSRERLARELAGDFDAIVSMALRKDARDRYASVEALADDVRAALDGRPTAARRGTTAYRAARFVRRHKASVAAVAAAFLALAAGLVATAWQAQKAERERDLARRRFAQVRALAHAVLFDYHDGIANLPGSTPVRERLVKDAQGYLDGLAAEAQDDVSLRRELAQAYLKLGDVQGDPFAASLGDLDGARASYLRARQLAEGVLAAAPSDWDARRVVSQSHEKVGALEEVTGRPEQALAEYELAHELDAALVAERPDDLDVRLAASRDDLDSGQLLLSQGRVDDASQRLERALAQRRAVLAKRDDSLSRKGVGAVLVSLSDVRQEQGRLPDAIAYATEARDVFAAAVKQYPDAVEHQRGLSRTWAQLAGLYRLSGDLARSEEVARQSLAQARAGVAADPLNAVAGRDLIVALANLAMTLKAKADWPAFEAVQDEMLATQRRLSAANPGNVQLRSDLVTLLATAGDGALQHGAFAPAEVHLQELLTVAQGLETEGGVTAMVVEEAAMAHSGLASVRAHEGRFSEALTEIRAAQAGLSAVLAANPGLERIRGRHAMAVATEGEYLTDAAKRAPKTARRAAWEAARAKLEEARTLLTMLAREGKGNDSTTGVTRDVEALLASCERALASP